MDSIQRSQKLLEARLTDLQTDCKANEASRRDDVRHFRTIFSEMQKALASVVSSMVSTQDGIRTVATVLTEVCRAVNTNASINVASTSTITGIASDPRP